MVGALVGAGAAVALGRRRLLRAPLPQTWGTIHVKGVEGPVTIARDRFGVPRIEALSDNDVCFAIGFCQGQDRGWQLEFYRRGAWGRISEFAGPEGLQTDRLMRTLGLRQAAEREAEQMDARTRELLDAYGAGVDAAFAAADALPLEMQLVRIEHEPWSAVDSLLVGKIPALGFSTNMEAELFRAELVARVGLEKAARLEPRYPSGNPVITDPGVAWSGDPLEVVEQIARVREEIGIGTEPAGSNNWVVSGARSVTGKPLLAGDPHITATIPDVWYTVEISTPDLEVRGGAMPGFPAVVIGQNRDVAWTYTNVMADVQDLFVERIREGEDGAGPEYEFRGEWRPVEVRREEIAVRGRAPEVLEVRETHHGPIVNGPLGAGRGEPLALAWTGLQFPFYPSSAMEIARARNGAELVRAFEAFDVPCMNLVWGDSSGSIGYKLVGKLPRRPNGVADVPKPGWTGEFDWDGYVPYDELPELVDPEGGTIVTANNRVAPADYPHHITSDYLEGWRAARIEQVLAQREKWSLDDFARMQLDVFSIPGEQTAHRLARLTPEHQREIREIERLKSWDHRLDADTIAGTIYQAFTIHFARAVSEAAIGDSGYAERWRSKSLLGFTPMVSSPWRFHARLLELWDEADPDLIGGRDWDEIALESLSSALDDLESRYGPDPHEWRWGRVHGMRFVHPFAEGKGRLAAVFEHVLGRWREVGGGQECINATGFVPHAGDYTGVWGPSYRLLADVGDPSRSRWQHMTGQSGHPGSPHYDDLLDGWVEGRTQPVEQPAEATLRLEPA
jgi:penicillin amidase